MSVGNSFYYLVGAGEQCGRGQTVCLSTLLRALDRAAFLGARAARPLAPVTWERA
jgi:hypothetical protein